jgi:hypothetical protein
LFHSTSTPDSAFDAAWLEGLPCLEQAGRAAMHRARAMPVPIQLRFVTALEREDQPN